jgi:hypothetical protein
MNNPVWVKISGVTKLPVRIFNVVRDAFEDSGYDLGLVIEMERAVAVESIRRAVFTRDNWECTHCGESVTWDGQRKGEMHERQWRGRGGEISLENSTTLCKSCHEHNKVAGHGARKVQWSSSRNYTL